MPLNNFIVRRHSDRCQRLPEKARYAIKIRFHFNRTENLVFADVAHAVQAYATRVALSFYYLFLMIRRRRTLNSQYSIDNIQSFSNRHKEPVPYVSAVNIPAHFHREYPEPSR